MTPPAPIGQLAASASSAENAPTLRRIGPEHLARHPIDQERPGANAHLIDIAVVTYGILGAEGAMIGIAETVTAGDDRDPRLM